PRFVHGTLSLPNRVNHVKGMSLLPKEVLEHGRRVVIVFNDEDAHSSGCLIRSGFVRLMRGPIGGFRWDSSGGQLDFKGRATAFAFTGGPNATLMRIDDATANRETKPKSAAAGIASMLLE